MLSVEKLQCCSLYSLVQLSFVGVIFMLIFTPNSRK